MTKDESKSALTPRRFTTLAAAAVVTRARAKEMEASEGGTKDKRGNARNNLKTMKPPCVENTVTS